MLPTRVLARRTFGIGRRRCSDVTCSGRSLHSVKQIVTYSGAWEAVVTFPKRNPFATNLMIGTGTFVVADANLQRMEGILDTRRVAFCTVFGLANAAMWWTLYIKFFSRWFPHAISFANRTLAEKLRDRFGQRDLAKQVAFDLLVFTPFAYFPFFYWSKALVHEGQHNPVLAVKDGLQRYRNTVIEDNALNMAVWIPGDILAFTVPAWLRMPVAYSIGFLWSSLLLWMRGAKPHD